MSSTSLYYTPPPKPPGAYRLVIASDIHLGHRNTPTAFVCENLRYYITNPVMFSTADVVIVPGDLHDTQLTLSAKAVSPLTRWSVDTLELAKHNNVAIRVLYGTPSHDRGQSERLVDLNANIGADLQYQSELAIVEDKTLGMTIGYVPDECRESYAQTEIEMEEMLKTRGLSLIDMFVMHGLFDFQLPIVHDSFTRTKWESWTKHAIIIGHDHNPKSKGKVTVPGPFDGLKHGEGVPGFIIIDILKSGEWVKRRIVNERAMRYETLVLNELDDYDAIQQIEKHLRTFEDFGHLKLKLDSEHMLAGHIIDWRQDFPKVSITVDKISVDVPEAIEDAEFKLNTTVINITNENIEGMIVREFGDKEIPKDLTEEINTIKSMMVVR